jgi:succinate-semialdehyde dehydrogenase / glutarate-semialdehyde dehydrogenase
MELKDRSLFRDQCYIDGKWIHSDSGEATEIYNPADGSSLGRVPMMGTSETRRAIEAAGVAFSSWGGLPAKKRSLAIHRWYDLVMENLDDLAVIMTSEQGKPFREARGEVAYAASFLEWFSEEAKRVYGDTLSHQHPDKRLVVMKQPVGVCAAITPWNFPSAMITRKTAPALAAGCTVVLKPAPQTPYSALALCELAHRAGIPAGVLNVVTGDEQVIGKELTANPMVRKLTFTGSTAVGKLLMRQCADTVKKISLELGGNAPFIVFGDADIDAAVEGAVSSKFRNTGQTCVCANRILVQDDIYDAFAEKLCAAVSRLRVGNGCEENTDLGPLIDMAAVDKVEAHTADAVARGARVLAGGGRHKLGGTFFDPTILAGVTGEMLVAGEETFGPLAPLFRFSTEAEAVAMANDTEFGLAAYFFTRDVSRVWRVSEALEYGMVGVNTGIISSEVVPFGGMKESGIGREGSKYGIDEFLEIKCVCTGGIK